MTTSHVSNPLEFARFLANRVVDGVEAGVSSVAILDLPDRVHDRERDFRRSYAERSAVSRFTGIATCAAPRLRRAGNWRFFRLWSFRSGQVLGILFWKQSTF